MTSKKEVKNKKEERKNGTRQERAKESKTNKEEERNKNIVSL